MSQINSPQIPNMRRIVLTFWALDMSNAFVLADVPSCDVPPTKSNIPFKKWNGWTWLRIKAALLFLYIYTYSIPVGIRTKPGGSIL